MKLTVQGFNWDPGNLRKCAKHGLSREEVEQFFTREISMMADVKHSQEESRFVAYGSNSKERPILVGFTFREIDGQILLRPISARYMHLKEVRKYEKETSKIQK